MKYVIFVGDGPSTSNVDPKVPFVGTKSYKTLLDWIYQMDIDVTGVFLCNRTDLYSCDEKYFFWDGRIEFSKRYPIVTLGNEADKFFEGTPHFKLPHPSGLNRKLNDKKWLDTQLKACKDWLSDR